jgi:hypothetical protein
MQEGLRGEFEAWAYQLGYSLDGTCIKGRTYSFESTHHAMIGWKAATERARARLYEALQSDLENGVAWLNDKAADEFRLKYPALCAEFVTSGG